jgi:hypothetical protein
VNTTGEKYRPIGDVDTLIKNCFKKWRNRSKDIQNSLKVTLLTKKTEFFKNYQIGCKKQYLQLTVNG